MKTLPQATLLAMALSVATAAAAQTAVPKAVPEAGGAELAAARAELQRAAQRVVELSRTSVRAPVEVQRRVIRKPVIGVLLAPDAKAGVRIAGVTPDSAAAAAGLRSGDRLVAIDGREILGNDGDLRVENARKLLGGLDTGTAVKLGFLRDGRTAMVAVTPRMDENVFVWNGNGPMAFDEGEAPLPPGVAPRIRREIIRLGPDGRCSGEDCSLPMMAEAFRWNGLNLATVDPALGRYFGTSSGVLVLSTGEALGGLQPGDVVRRVDGKPVNSPREAMAALHARPPGSSVLVEYLRDRKAASARVTVPRALPFRIPPPPPAPPAPPAPPSPPGVAPPAPPAPPARPSSQVEGTLRITEESQMLALVPPAPPAPPAVVAPPAAPPAPPAPPVPMGTDGIDSD